MSFRRRPRSKLYYFFYFHGELLYFWFCVLVGTLMGISDFMWGDAADQSEAVANAKFDERYENECD
jgi:hypothetical protein